MDEILAWLESARSIAALTGAGISAESGIPTFRGPGGFWRNYRPEDLATPQAFARDPELVWQWYDWRRGLIAKAQPNAGHLALAEIERRHPRFTLITQNVDGLHDRAGSRNILKVHGDIWTLRCPICGHEYQDLRTPLPELPPRCSCGELLRPGVVWFGESLPPEIWLRAEQAACEADLFFVIGTSAVVYPAAGLIETAKSSGAKVVEINPEKTAVSDLVDVSLRGPAAEILPALMVEQASPATPAITDGALRDSPGSHAGGKPVFSTQTRAGAEPRPKEAVQPSDLHTTSKITA